jgi:hypothetical protein
MQLTVSGKQVDLSDALRVHVAQHLDVITHKYFDHALEAQVTFSKARSFFTCDINLHAGRGITVRGEGEAAMRMRRLTMRPSISQPGSGATGAGYPPMPAIRQTAPSPSPAANMC